MRSRTGKAAVRHPALLLGAILLSPCLFYSLSPSTNHLPYTDLIYPIFVFPYCFCLACLSFFVTLRGAYKRMYRHDPMMQVQFTQGEHFAFPHCIRTVDLNTRQSPAHCAVYQS